MPADRERLTTQQERDMEKVTEEIRQFLNEKRTGRIDITIRQGRIQRTDKVVQRLWSLPEN